MGGSILVDRLLTTLLVVAIAVVFGVLASGASKVCTRVGAHLVHCNDTNKVYKLEEIEQ